ncbi:MAG: NAD(P)(+) transhydrogenase (Re/Si-specific) subunit beta [Candidatus Manganitrophus sp.]|nr:NAD(P)(+) transhydrogenase (Re/Si-specific) subunit beta [Candidatus Manganitrophus sp.]MDC4225042.1 NAD(P)(+) transhydrogenase (Re/Si-specific) subunit beta [Candidatus Manganitrophus sp.]WDT71699.1 MAG: NAD(P)(+) transhydrogenase (Re/Si-specific) subunit beta [Candidatus Manganitrophus sp.]
MTMINFFYLVSSLFFILGLKGLTHPDTARRGMFMAEFGMLLAVVGTLFHHDIVNFTWIIAGLVLGSTIGLGMGLWIPMTAVPQRTAFSHALGALAATLVGVSEYYRHGAELSKVTMTAIGFEVLIGGLTVTGSLMAAGKLHGTIGGSPVTYKGQNASNIGLLFVMAGLLVYLVFNPGNTFLFYIMLAAAAAFGFLLVLPIGAADMPVVMSLLNSYAGLADAAMGFVLMNKIQIITGSLDGSSGVILSILMCKAMNRPITNVLFGAFGQAPAASTAQAPAEQPKVRSGSPKEAGELFKKAKRAIIVPGYGMAVAQAQHAVRELATLLEKEGITVKYAIHPVAGRMPGHMNVLLAEANIPYEQLIDMDDINPEFEETDVSLVLGANDVVNPAAKTDPASPIYGMPILDVEKSKAVIVIKRSMNPGFAGIENELFYRPNTLMVFGDAKGTVEKIAAAFKELV